MKHIYTPLAITLIAFFAPNVGFAEEPLNVQLTGVAELGFLGVIDHDVQFSKEGTSIDYDDEAGQDVLFPVSRLSLDLEIADKHTLTFLYQPLAIETTEVLSRDIVVDGLTFPAGEPVRFFYGFPFYRLSYLYDLLDHPKHELGVGGALQIRNATITFSSLDGKRFRANRGVGPVPLLKLRGRYRTESGLWFGTEIDGFYAPVSYINGSDEEIVGAILDASARVGFALPLNTDAFFNLRYLGGGAVGTSEPDNLGSDGYVRNWLHFTTVTIGFEKMLL